MARQSRLPLEVFARHARRRAMTLLMRDLFSVARVAAVILSQVKNRLTLPHHPEPGCPGVIVACYEVPALFLVPITSPRRSAQSGCNSAGDGDIRDFSEELGTLRR